MVYGDFLFVGNVLESLALIESRRSVEVLGVKIRVIEVERAVRTAAFVATKTDLEAIIRPEIWRYAYFGSFQPSGR